MSALEELPVTRRTLFTAATLGGLSLIAPITAVASECNFEVEVFPAFPGLSESEIDEISRRAAEEEAKRIIEEAVSSNVTSTRASRGRPSYSTVYGPTQIKASGWHDVAGQGPGGVHIDGGGDIHVQPSGGGSVSISVPLPNGVGSVGVSISKARRGMSATEYAVHIDGNGFWKATANIENKVTPFVVYETIDGVKKVYKKAASNTYFRMSLGKRKVG